MHRKRLDYHSGPARETCLCLPMCKSLPCLCLLYVPCFLSSGGTHLSLSQPFTVSPGLGDACTGWPAGPCPDLWCPISLQPAIRAQLKAALFSQQKDISAASWEPATGWTCQGGPSLVVAPVWETLAQPWLGPGGWGPCMPQASQALGGVFFLCPCWAQPTATATHSSVLGFGDHSKEAGHP